MALKKWYGAALIVSVLSFSGCATPEKKDPNSSPTGAATTPAVATQTPEVTPPAETASPSETPAATESPSATESPTAGETPTSTGTPVAAAGGNAELLADLENADGMKGYEEVKAMTPPPSTPEMVAKGKELFAANCANCHGAAGMGDGEAGAALEPKPRNLTATAEYKYGHLELALFRTGTYGVEGTGMAPWDGIIEPADQWATTHYVKTLQK